MKTTRCPLCGQAVIEARSYAQVPALLEVEPGTTKNHYLELLDGGLVRAVLKPSGPLYRGHEVVCRERRGKQA